MTMRHLLWGALIGAHAWAGAAASERVIYGDDDRFDLFHPDNDPKMVEAARATALVIRRTEMAPALDDRTQAQLRTVAFKDSLNLCEDEPFRDQPTVGFCSAFLVAPDVLVTAGHCIRSASSCTSSAFVFGFGLASEEQDLSRVPMADVYHCKELIAQELAPGLGTDYAVIRLDRPVLDRKPLVLRRHGVLESGAELTVIGHPMTLPTKIAGGRSAVRANDMSKAYFTASLDTYGGNSGSAVLNSETYEVEGILVRGEQDMERHPSQGCMRSKVCSQDGCRGEDVTRISEVLEAVTPEPTDPRPVAVFEVAQDGLALDIPDNDREGVVVPFEVTAVGDLASLELALALEHAYPRDLQVELVHPSGREVLVASRGGIAEPGGTVAVSFSTQSVAALRPLRGLDVFGTWKIVVKDLAPRDTGVVTGVRLTLGVYQDEEPQDGE